MNLLKKLIGLTGLRVGGAVMTVATTVVAGRALGATFAGMFFWCVAAASLLGVIGRLCLDKWFIRVGSAYDEALSANDIVRSAGARYLKFVAIPSGLLALMFIASWRVHFWPEATSVDWGIVLAFAACIPLIAVVNFAGSVSIGAGSASVGTMAI